MAACLICGGTGTDAAGNICTACNAASRATDITTPWIPVAYQRLKFSPDALPLEYKGWGQELVNLQRNIVNGIETGNILLCSPFRSGKTVWSYDILKTAGAMGWEICQIYDINEISNFLKSYRNEDADIVKKISSVRMLIVRIPNALPYNLVDAIQTLLYRRVRNNGFTIFLYSGYYKDLKEMVPHQSAFENLMGDGTMTSIRPILMHKNKEVN